MNLKIQKRLAARLLKSSAKRIKLNTGKLDDIKEALTKSDIRELISDGAITADQKTGVSRSRAKKRQEQKRKGLRKGKGSRKGTLNSRIPKKTRWANKIRSQRQFLRELKENEIITNEIYRKLLGMAKGNFFRSKRHIKLYINERELALKEAKQ